MFEINSFSSPPMVGGLGRSRRGIYLGSSFKIRDKAERAVFGETVGSPVRLLNARFAWQWWIFRRGQKSLRVGGSSLWLRCLLLPPH